MTTERKSEITARLPATTEDGKVVMVDERTQFVRYQYVDETWKPWQVDERSYWLGMEPLQLSPDGSMRDRSGRVFQLSHRGQGG